jgi:hypothetical protein
MTTKTKTTSVTIRVYDAHAEREREVKFYGHSFTPAWEMADQYLADRPYLTQVQLAEEEYEPEVHCSICDGIGHGQPGYGPCPLEERGADDGFDEWEASRGVIQFDEAYAAARAEAEKPACKHPYYHEKREGTFVPGAGVMPSDLIEHICSSCGEKIGQHFYHGRAWNE